MAGLWNRLRGRQRYTALPFTETEPTSPSKSRRPRRLSIWFCIIPLISISGLIILYALISVAPTPPPKSCDSIDEGYRCSPKISRFWGQYSLWFSVPSEIDVNPPEGCSITFAQVLSRHGGRDPTSTKTMAYSNLIEKIQKNAKSFPGEFAFLKTYNYTMGADLLTNVGKQQMVNSGIHFYRRYRTLLSRHKPFVRSTDQPRVVESAEKWLQGFAQAANLESLAAIDVTIPEKAGANNTISHGTCSAFEDGPYNKIYEGAQEQWTAQFIAPILERVNSKLEGANLDGGEIIFLMDICPFSTVASPTAQVSKFCHLFSETEWQQYDYYRSLEKYYHYMNGNPLGPTQGVGYVNELLARLTETPVEDETSTNRTLDSDPKTFPLDRKVYADFSHDNDMSGIFAAIGLYNKTKPLSNVTLQSTKETHGYSAAWTVPFAARAYFEKMKCEDEPDEYIRIIINDRVMPLEFCGGDEYGRCRLEKFVESQSFARHGGHWDQCPLSS